MGPPDSVADNDNWAQLTIGGSGINFGGVATLKRLGQAIKAAGNIAVGEEGAEEESGGHGKGV